MTIHHALSDRLTSSRWILISLLVLVACLGRSALEAQEDDAAWVRGHAADNNVLRFQVAQAIPRGEADFWPDNKETFTGKAEDLEDLSLTIDYQRRVGSRFALMLSGGYYEGSTEQAYLDFVDSGGNDILHTTSLQRAVFTAGLVGYPLGRDVVIAPYLGGGLGAHLWRLEEKGDFLDFNFTPPVIFQPAPSFSDEEVSFGSFWLVGLEIPLTANWAAFAEARWQRAEQELGGDFNGFGDLDLSSREIGAGASVSF